MLKTLLLLASMSLLAQQPGTHQAAVSDRTKVELPAYHWGDKMAFSIRGTDEDRPPFMRVFADSKTKDGKDAADVLGTLKFGRGKSHLYPKEDADKGLIVVFRGLSLEADKAGTGYRAVFQGEFNAVQATVSKETMEMLLSGKPTTLDFHSQTTKGIFPAYYTVTSDTQLKVRIEGKNLLIDGVSGSTTIRYTNSVTRSDITYPSEKVEIDKEKGQPVLYTGRPGALADLPILNK